MLSAYSFQALAVYAANTGPILSVVLALITLMGVIVTGIVTVHKARSEANVALKKMTSEQKQSDIKLTHEIMSQTVVFLDDRINKERIEHAREIEELKTEHDRDIKRLEESIAAVKADHDQCRERNRVLLEENTRLKAGGSSGGI
jgi:hypothetical protein